ncbi:MAG TPA: hypothetical protein VD788_16145 [Candidatus Polarisedimenticolaceae bacterium]|nr:hypothetical protein [Candidatus Polarisedimenticolaceae bacterium]
MREPSPRRALALACLLGLLCGFGPSCRGPQDGSGEDVGGETPAAAVAGNPPAAGFDLAGSDPQAIEVADSTMEAMGGRRAWDEARFLVWNFFGFRFHVWDKQTGDIRVEYATRDEPVQQVVVLMNLGTREGRAFVDGQPVADAEREAELLQHGYEAWVNDGYWLFMPYKLKDSGVTLSWLGERQMLDGRPADVLQLVFAGVGVTPENKYDVYVARDSGLVEQWDFYADRADDEPRFQTPWHDWRPRGAIMLSGDRGQRQITEIAVYEELPPSVFDSPEPTGLRQQDETS